MVCYWSVQVYVMILVIQVIYLCTIESVRNFISILNHMHCFQFQVKVYNPFVIQFLSDF